VGHGGEVDSGGGAEPVRRRLRAMKHVILLIVAVALVGCVTNDAVVVVDFDQLEGESYREGESDRYFKGKPFTGIAVSKWPNGQKLWERNYWSGMEHGLQTSWYENGQKKEERPYKKRARHGLFTKWHPNGQKSEEFKMSYGHPVGRSTEWYDNGQKKSEIPPLSSWGLHGLRTEWHRNGQKKEKSTYKKGNRWGLSTEWHENGQKKVEGTYFSGHKSGLFTEWYENGQKAGEITYSNGSTAEPFGNRAFTKRWDEDGDPFTGVVVENKYSRQRNYGQKHWEATYKDGKMHGLTEWYSNGKKGFEKTYKDDKANGLWTKWWYNGQKMREWTYKDGKFISSQGWDRDGNPSRFDKDGKRID